MPNIGLTEILVVLAIALMVIGPKKLPDLGRSAGRAIREFRRAGSTMQKELGLDEVADDVRGLRDQVQKAKESVNVRKQLGLDDLGPLDLDGEQAAVDTATASAGAATVVASTEPASATVAATEPANTTLADTAAALPVDEIPAVATASRQSDESLGAPDAAEPPAVPEAAEPTAIPEAAAPTAIPEAAAPTVAAPTPAPTEAAPARKKRAAKPRTPKAEAS